MRGLNVAAIVAALVIGVIGLLVGGGWGIVLLEVGAVLVVVVLFIRNLNREEDGDAAG